MINIRDARDKSKTILKKIFPSNKTEDVFVKYQKLIDRNIPPDSDVDLELRSKLIDRIEEVVISRHNNQLDIIDIPFQNQRIRAIVADGKKVIVASMHSMDCIDANANTWDGYVEFSGQPYPLRKWFEENVLTIEDYYNLEATLLTIM